MSRLVIIDDDPIHHKIVQYMLTKNELARETTYAFDGKLVLDYLSENRMKISALPDFIFLDLYMPNHSGWDFLNGFQEIYQTLKKDIKVYVVTSSIFQMDIIRSKSYPFVTKYITKPLMKSVFDTIKGKTLRITGPQLN
ncbi:MAG TPA: response regulator [Mucilaginibacter sp.]|nr:response regulator [Mucilaginibacter sp.]